MKQSKLIKRRVQLQVTDVHTLNGTIVAVLPGEDRVTVEWDDKLSGHTMWTNQWVRDLTFCED